MENLKQEINVLVENIFLLTEDIKSLDNKIETITNPETEIYYLNKLFDKIFAFNEINLVLRDKLGMYMEMETKLGMPTNLNYHKLYKKLSEEY